MGLDASLECVVSLSLDNDESLRLRESIKNLFGPFKMLGNAKAGDTFTGFIPVSVNFEVMYWRKAHDIHNWFVENIQDGKDEDCGRRYCLGASKLHELLMVVNKMVESYETIPKEDQEYLSREITMTRETKEGLEKLLTWYEALPKTIQLHVYFYYHATW